MNLQEFISSGILESYVLGTASLEERKQVEQMAAAHEEVKTELYAIEEALSSYASRHAVEPPSYLKARVMGAIQGKPESGKVIPIRNENPVSYWIYVAAAACIAAIYMGMQLGDLKLSLSEAKDQLASMSDKYEAEKKISAEYGKQAEEMRSKLAVLASPSSKMVCLMGREKMPDALAHVYWNTSNKEVYLEVNRLPMPPGDKQYQLWAMVNGKPVDAGVIAMSADTTPELYRMKVIPEAEAFAITLEKKGGSAAPEGDMYVLGKI